MQKTDWRLKSEISPPPVKANALTTSPAGGGDKKAIGV